MGEKIKQIDKKALLSEVTGKKAYVDPESGALSGPPIPSISQP
ncbi:MAG: hypothetical protein QXR38_01175 [Nitrososphaerales archaeon]